MYILEASENWLSSQNDQAWDISVAIVASVVLVILTIKVRGDHAPAAAQVIERTAIPTLFRGECRRLFAEWAPPFSIDRHFLRATAGRLPWIAISKLTQLKLNSVS